MAYNTQYTKPAYSADIDKKSQDTNTSGVRFMNYDKMKYLAINYWKKACTIDIGIIPAGMSRGSGASWNWKDTPPANIHLSLTFNTLTTLESNCDEVWEALKKTGTFSNIGAICGLDLNNMVEINNGSTLGMETGIYLVLYKNIDQNTGKPGNMEVYPFATREVIRNYDYRTGQKMSDTNALQEFKDFRRIIHEACSALTMAYAHTVSESINPAKTSIAAALGSISKKLGVDGTSSSASIGTNQQGSTYNKSQYKGQYQGNKKQYQGTGTNYRKNNYSQYPQTQHQDTPPWESTDITLNSPDQANFFN